MLLFYYNRQCHSHNLDIRATIPELRSFKQSPSEVTHTLHLQCQQAKHLTWNSSQQYLTKSPGARSSCPSHLLQASPPPGASVPEAKERGSVGPSTAAGEMEAMWWTAFKFLQSKTFPMFCLKCFTFWENSIFVHKFISKQTSVVDSLLLI